MDKYTYTQEPTLFIYLCRDTQEIDPQTIMRDFLNVEVDNDFVNKFVKLSFKDNC